MELVSLTWGRTSHRAQLAHGYETIDHLTGQVYAAVLERRGREPRPPLDWDRIGAVLQGLAEGLGLRSKIDPHAVQSFSESDPSLYAVAAAALLAILTRPEGDHATAHQAIRHLLDDG